MQKKKKKIIIHICVEKLKIIVNYIEQKLLFHGPSALMHFVDYISSLEIFTILSEKFININKLHKNALYVC